MLSKSKELQTEHQVSLFPDTPPPGPGTLHWVLHPSFRPPSLLAPFTFCPGLLPKLHIFLILLGRAILFSPAQIHLQVHLCESKSSRYSIEQKCFPYNKFYLASKTDGKISCPTLSRATTLGRLGSFLPGPGRGLDQG